MKLSDKEMAVITLLLKGLKPAQIMRELALTKAAYDSRRRSTMRKLKAKNDLQMGIHLQRRMAVRSEAVH